MTCNILRVFSSLLAPRTVQGTRRWKHTSSCPSVRCRSFRPCLEQLEDRQLLNAVTFADGTFNNYDWTGKAIPYDNPGGNNDFAAAVSAFTSGQVASGGNPGAYQGMTKNWTGPGGILVGELRKDAVYDPSKSGAISSIDFSLDGIAFIDARLGVDFRLLLVQNGTYYISGIFYAFQGQGWQHFGLQNQTASDFPIVPGSSSGPAFPDFSAKGGPIHFGYLSGNGVADAETKATSSGVDNWSVTIHGPTANLVLNRVSTTNPSEVSVNYTVSNSDSVPFNIGIYRSATPNYDPSAAVNVGTIVISESDKLKIRTHDVQLTTEDGLPNKWLQPDPLHPYVLAVADPNNQTGETDSAHNTASFHVYVIAAVVPGFGEIDPSTPPAWALEIANALQRDPNMIGFDKVFAFGWNSTAPEHSLIVDAGTELSSQIKGISRSAFRNLEANDVIDVTLIGHSRGGVVISEAMRFLENGVIPQLRHGYKEMFLIDPHPANLKYDLPLIPPANASLAPGLLGEIALGGYLAFEALVHDPPVVIPADVNLAEEWYQHTPWYLLSPLNGEGILNFWGLSPSLVEIESPAQTVFETTNLTSTLYNGDFVGHSETHNWFLTNIVPELLNPFTLFH